MGEEQHIRLPEAALLVAIGYDHTTDTLCVGASLGGDQIQLLGTGIGSFVPAQAYDTIKFRGAVGGHSGQGEVVEMRVFGGLIDTDTALTNTGMPAAFENLDFLSPP